jgi:acyl carrier protein
VLGGIGFGAYAAANAYLNAFAAERTRAGETPWTSVAWDGWSDGRGAAASATGRLAMTPAEGVEAFARLMDAGAAPLVVVSTADLQVRIAQWVRPPAVAPREAASEPKHARPEQLDYVAPRTEIERMVAQIWEELLGVDRVGVHDDFFTLGGHSLLGTQIMSRVRAAFAVDLSLTALFAAPTVSALSARVEAGQRAGGAAESMADLVRRVKSMSPEEKARLLARARDGAGTTS